MQEQQPVKVSSCNHHFFVGCVYQGRSFVLWVVFVGIEGKPFVLFDVECARFFVPGF